MAVMLAHRLRGDGALAVVAARFARPDARRRRRSGRTMVLRVHAHALASRNAVGRDTAARRGGRASGRTRRSDAAAARPCPG